MKDTIRNILDEQYDFGREVKPLSFSCDVISCAMSADSEQFGSFYIMGEKNTRGFVYCTDLRFQLRVTEFTGGSCEIPYRLSSKGLEPGDVHKGTVFIISDHGEYELPFEINILSEIPGSSLGDIRNLFHFTNLAMTDWKTACDLFYSGSFVNILSGTDSQYTTAYRALSVYSGNQFNMEKFLQIAHKKVPPAYGFDCKEIDMDISEAEVPGEITVRREGWGYSRLAISVQGDFLENDTEIITSSDFEKNEAVIGYHVVCEKLHAGLNKGRIVINSENESYSIPVCVHALEAVPDHRDRKLLIRLTSKYIDFRVGRITKAEWCRESAAIITPVLSEDTDRVDLRLVQAQILLMEKRTEEAGRILEMLSVRIETEEQPPELRGFYCYLKSMYASDPIMEESLADEVWELYRENDDNWRLAWLCLYMRDEYKNSVRKRDELLRDQFEKGCRSPLMLLEAVHLFIADPKQMEKLGRYELTVMRFALKFGITSSSLRERFAFLSDDVHAFSEDLLGMLIECYEIQPDRDILASLCTHLMRGNCIGSRYFRWYSDAVEQEIRMARLYEYYMMSISHTYDGLLPKIVLMYFAYRSNLDSARTALLYANVLRHKTEYTELYERYEESMSAFVEEQLLNRSLDENMAFLYSSLLNPFDMAPEFGNAYTELLFTERVRIADRRAVNVVLVYEHLQDEYIYPLFNGEALIPIYGEMVNLFWEDDEGNRRELSDRDERTLIIEDDLNPDELCNADAPELGGVLYVSELGNDSIRINENNEAMLSWLSLQENVTEAYSGRLMIDLAQYYFENDNIAMLDELLLRLEPERMSRADREICVRIMVARGLYDEAFSWICECGSEGIDYKILLRLCDRVIVRRDYEYDPQLLSLCSSIMSIGKYDEESLIYLLKYACGTTRYLKEIWRAADTFGVDVQGFLAGMLTQILFSGADVKEKYDIYSQFSEGATDSALERAVLSALSYDMFVNEAEGNEKCYERIMYYARQGERLTHFSVFSFLQYAAGKKAAGTITVGEMEIALYFIKQMWGEGIFLPCFMNFKEEEPRLRIFSGQSFIEYCGHPDSHVILHYVTSAPGVESDEYKKEEMLHVYGGVYIKSFVLFKGEKINYYITEENDRREKLTKASVLEAEETVRIGTPDRYSMINSVAVMAQDQADGMNAKAEEYELQAYLTDKLFMPYGYKDKV